MNCFVCIELVEQYKAASFYSMRLGDENSNEFEKFLSFHEQDFKSDLTTIAYWINKVGTEGPSLTHLRDEGRQYVKAFPSRLAFSRLRLYAYVLGDSGCILLGGGGEKRTRTFQEDPNLSGHWNVVRAVGNKVLRYINSGNIKVQGHLLKGKLCFNVEL